MFVVFLLYMFVFFCKQKTAYEMRISDWSSDVCSSDLLDRFFRVRRRFSVRGRLLRILFSQLGFTSVGDVIGIASRRKIETGWNNLRTAPASGPIRRPKELHHHPLKFFRVFFMANTAERSRDRKRTRLNSSHSCAPR